MPPRGRRPVPAGGGHPERWEREAVGDSAVTIKEIKAAKRRLSGVAHETPLQRARALEPLVEGMLFLKLENLQRTGSYKIRGAYNKIALLPEAARRRGVIAASAGNHAQGVAYAARTFDIPCTIVMPETAPRTKIQGTASYGARVILHGRTYDEAYAYARRMAEAEGLTYVHAFDDPDVIAGQGTVGLEIVKQAPELDLVVVPVGGGGLLSGVATAVRALSPETEVVGVQAAGAAAFVRSLERGERVTLDDVHTLADGIAVKAPGTITFDVVRRLGLRMVTVTDEEIVRAITLLLEREKFLVEGAGAAALAAVLAGKVPAAGRRVAAVVSGGNIDLKRLSTLIAEPAEAPAPASFGSEPPPERRPERFSAGVSSSAGAGEAALLPSDAPASGAPYSDVPSDRPAGAAALPGAFRRDPVHNASSG
ncbi:MAG: threonine ammonia-lyase [Hydrogenibacillus schlegelii]|uniref:L-threonine dehydratase catabolic TdcB n=1 Tax=Hydrogenibacillus schlegelii TaxID=1484 RepID=A0A947GAN5_HYDSH|nr:threonine ammonia-lyase [Hydrogenibacillus schlegelii]